MSGLPYPTPTRLRLAEAIREGDVRHYHWTKPWTCDIPRNRNVTARVAELVAAGLAELGEPIGAVRRGGSYSAVTMTEAGNDWYLRAMRGPGSTSPEPGRCSCPTDPDDEKDPGDPISTCPVHGWARSTSPEPGPPPAEPTFNPAYRVARCGQLSAHGPHVMEHGPDVPRNCPGTGARRGEVA